MNNLFTQTIGHSAEQTKPIIGITLCHDNYGLIMDGVEYGFIRKEYGQQVRAAGGIPIFLDASIDPADAARVCNGIIISGGQDIHPKFYGQAPTPHLGQMEPTERTEWENQLIDACDRQDRHILGICYGSQLLNVHYGGTLYQDIHAEQGSDFNHGSSEGPAMHDIIFATDFLGFEKGRTVPVASRHHQAVHDIAPGFEIVAKAPDGIVEAIKNSQHYGIQWHSESDGTAPKIYKAFVDLCAKQANIAAANDAAGEPIPV
ncbi:MAG TPA: gamma-glutamyl-gamma-aminobutyrate hydrolase family protein [Candidatus Saccharimonadales bacterium]|nr:gamma-glutamyl-gamma-aminobutyrate hydrolase family protein [Candidatus Saccharimonadales bacterium]